MGTVIKRTKKRKISVKKNLLKIKKNRRQNREKLRFNFNQEEERAFDIQTIIIVILIILLSGFVVKEIFYRPEKKLTFIAPDKVFKLDEKYKTASKNEEKKPEDTKNDDIEIIREGVTEQELAKSDYTDDKLVFEELDEVEPVVEREIKTVEKPVFNVDDFIEKDALWRKYQQKVDRKKIGDKPVIAVIIDDVGLNKDRTLKLIDIDKRITLSFLPYGRNLDKFSKSAREKGHEVMLHVPMEPKGSYDPGPNALFVKMSKEEMTDKFNTMLSRIDGFIGVNNHMGSRFTTNEKSMQSFLEIIKEKDLIFVDSKTLQNSFGDKLSEDMGIPYTSRDVFLDHEINEDKIKNQLIHLEKKAVKYGYAVGIGHPHKITINTLEKWLPSLEEKGIELVPISYIIDINYAKMLASKRENNKISLKNDEKNAKTDKEDIKRQEGI